MSPDPLLSGETNDFPIYNMYGCQVLFNSLTEHTSSFTQLEEIPDKDWNNQPNSWQLCLKKLSYHYCSHAQLTVAAS